MSSRNSKNFGIGSDCSPEQLSCVALLMTFLRLKKEIKHCWGPTEQLLREASQLDRWAM